MAPFHMLRGAGKWFTLAVTTSAALVGLAVNTRNLGLSPFTVADLAARRLTVSPAEHVLTAIGDSLPLAATVTDEHGATLAGATLLWRTDDSAVVTVDSAGVVVARGPGTALVSVSVRDYIARSTITVSQRLAGLRLAGDSLVRLREEERLRLEARPLDPRGYPIRGLMPLWSSDDTSVVKIDSSGMATAGAPGRAVITATLERYSAGVPVEVLLAPASMVLVSGADQRVPAGNALPQPVVVRVLSRGDRPVPGVDVTFTMHDELGKIQPVAATTDRTGRVRAVWTLGALPGRQTVSITADGLDTTVFLAAEGDPVKAKTRVDPVGPAQTGRAGEALAQPVGIQLTDAAGVAVARVPVAWTALDGGSVEPLGERTDSLGRARARWTLGPKAGSQRLRAHVGNPRTFPAHTFTATAMPGWPAALKLHAGNGQRGRAGSTLRDIAVRVTDASGNPVPDREVVAVPVAGAVEDSIRSTDANGVAAFRWTLGTAAGRNEIAFHVAGFDSVQARGTAVALARPAANLSIEAAGTASAGRPVSLTATLTDDYGNVVSGAQIVFTASSGTVAPARVATDRRGRAAAKWTPGAKSGEQTVTGSARGTSVKGTYSATVGTAARGSRNREE